MGIVGFLHFALKCVDLFAWPIFALAYPLFASIRAIETNSNHHMRKLVTYWILFSLISLFEHAFDKFIEWFPLWAYIKIVAICWLVLPRFGHSYNAYKILILLCSYVNLQVINWSNKQDKEPFLKTQETFLSVAEKFIKENGSEALEELIAKKSKVAIPNLDVEQITAPANTEEKEKATKIKVSKPNVYANEKMAVTITEKKEMATTIEGAKPDLEQIKAPANTEKKEKRSKNKSKVAERNLDPKEKMAVPTFKSTITEPKEMATAIESKGAKPDVEEIKAPANTEKKEKATKIKSEGAKPNLDAEEIKVANTEKEEMAAIEVKRAKANLVETERRKAEVVEVKEMNYCPSSLDKFQTQWTCAVCHVTTMSPTTLYSHFQGRKHLAKCQKLKAKKQTPENNNSSSSLPTKFQRN